MRQQLLDLQLAPRYAYAEWVRHSGVEAAQNRLALWLVHGGRLWLTSENPCGKTHLAHLLTAEHPHLALIRVQTDVDRPAARQVADWLEYLRHSAFWLLDVPSGSLPKATAIALFHLLERAREGQRNLVLFWRQRGDASAPPELMTRLATLERIDMQSAHKDDELTAVLSAVAEARQWQVDEAVIRLLLVHLPRNLDTLIDALGQMEHASLSERKQLTRRWASMHIKAHRQRSEAHLPFDALEGR
ncbi:MAG: hypothetical protein R8K53_04855 [Mariprofundaceae bacterium]